MTFPDDDDLAFELLCDGFDRRFVSHERAILFRVTTECHGIFRRIVSSVDPDTTLFTKTPSSNSPSGRTKISATTLDTASRTCRWRTHRIRRFFRTCKIVFVIPLIFSQLFLRLWSGDGLHFNCLRFSVRALFRSSGWRSLRRWRLVRC